MEIDDNDNENDNGSEKLLKSKFLLDLSFSIDLRNVAVSFLKSNKLCLLHNLCSPWAIYD